jgi:hypothetical protein
MTRWLSPTRRQKGPWPPNGRGRRVYNSANIRDQQVIWKQEVALVEGKKLIHYRRKRWLNAIEWRFGRLAQRRGLSVLVVGLSALPLRAALLPILPIPDPLIQDEFGYLLGADTFAHGRLSNPTPALWPHFESLMILLKPTCSSKYPSAQSLFMAAGQVLMGRPFWGVWLSIGLMCAAICWMLQAWVGEGWALLGGFLAVARTAVFSYWADSYWGGAVPGSELTFAVS